MKKFKTLLDILVDIFGGFVRLARWFIHLIIPERHEKVVLQEDGTSVDLVEVSAGNVLDGDTVIVWCNKEKIILRLYGIDCPENGQDWGNFAKAGLIKMIGGCSVYLETFGKDKYDRVLATIFVKDGVELINVNEKMVVKGHAWVTRVCFDKLSKGRQIQLNNLESWAKKKRVGLWRDENPVPPWEWRRGA